MLVSASESMHGPVLLVKLLKEIDPPQIKILSSFTHPYVISNLYCTNYTGLSLHGQKNETFFKKKKKSYSFGMT